MSHRSSWHHLPESIRRQARARWLSGKRAAGPGDGYLYHWIFVNPPVGYRGPLPVGQLLRRTREV